MLDLGWSEILIIGVVALIVVGPKDLPKMLRTLGQYAGRAKGIARDFRRSMDDAAREADIEELKEVKKGLDDMREEQFKMQRDMGQSFLDGPSNTAKKSDKKPADTAAKTKSDDAPAAAADVSPDVSSKPEPEKVVKPAAKEAEPGSVSGA